jgi:hypothetical protein
MKQQVESKTQISVLITKTARELLVQNSAGPHAIGYELDRIIQQAYAKEKK